MKKHLKRITVITLILALSCLTAFGAVPNDVKGQPYEEAVAALFEKDILTGDTDGSFKPESQLTRAQACIIVVKAMNPPVAEVAGTATQTVPKSGFSDMTGYGWAEGYITYAVKHGVTKGYPDGTFKPGNKVTINELVTMVLRAAAFTDETLGGTWPKNYVNKAEELSLFKGVTNPLPVYSTKWMAAQISYNALERIEAANPLKEAPGQGTDQNNPSVVPDTSKMTYVSSGSFNSAITAYNGKNIAEDITIYTYGLKKEYKAQMTFSSKKSDYREDTLYKYKNVETPAFYKLENNKIVAMVIPMDVGFSGKAYSVINSKLTSLNAKGDIVTGLETLTATREITWLGMKGLGSIPTSTGPGQGYLDGTVYEINLIDGEIQSIFKSTESYKGKLFEEISSAGSDFVEVKSYRDGVVTIVDTDGGKVFEVKSNASVYVLDSADQKEYSVGRLSNIKAGVGIRAYDISDDDESAADIIVILK